MRQIGTTAARLAREQTQQRMPLALQQPLQMLRHVATKKDAPGTSASETVGQRQATHEMPGTDLLAGIDTQSNFQGFDSLTKLRRTGIPAACIAALAPAGVSSVKWKMLAAATAEAPACCTTSIMCW
ncbi:hypothetical protein D3C78_1293520 [compost metagenome]